ncbi:iron-containing alcohol dehydrogenase family protein [Halosimplex pelagicum]|uniref:Iron-containing alcohol dehydrogenase n=1 Tax=Halosimplex pelagicum TaxID=869886 RepID=A0A7D5PCK7_9EURY|nr:iron-containing alcohol dehydrogenase family protein [Halosimplex pelagicum]QLH84784.1 iron-containing alcohol dehydrogenase [Halosimplex pelagicum]
MTPDGGGSERRFAFDYDPGELRCRRGAAADLGELLATRDCDDALVVTGSNVGANRDVMGPVEAGLGDRLAGVFDETTPEKYLQTGLDAAERVREGGIDALVAVGSGSSLDVAKVASALSSHDDLRAAAERSVESGEVAVAEDRDPTPIVAVPTTLAGADLSVIAGVSLSLDPEGVPDDEIPNGSVGDRRLMPTALVYDLALFETTPKGVLCASAMNGFDKAVECLYSPHRTPVTDGTAMRALSLVESGFETLPDDDMDEGELYDAVAGVVLAQYGISTPDAYRASVVHAFGHGFSHDYDAHQGTVHGILAPHVLRYVFDEVDGRRELLAEAFGVADESASDEELAESVIRAVTGVSDDLGLPDRLRELDGLSREDFPAIAAEIRDDGLMDAAPEGLDPTTDDIEAVLDAAW